MPLAGRLGDFPTRAQRTGSRIGDRRARTEAGVTFHHRDSRAGVEVEVDALYLKLTTRRLARALKTRSSQFDEPLARHRQSPRGLEFAAVPDQAHAQASPRRDLRSGDRHGLQVGQRTDSRGEPIVTRLPSSSNTPVLAFTNSPKAGTTRRWYGWRRW